MRLPAAMVAALSLAVPAEAEERKTVPRVAPAIVHETTPALGYYTDAVLFDDLWKRPDLTPRDRSLVTIAALISGGSTGQMTGHFNRGLDNGIKPSEISAIITHLAFYSGWPRGIAAVEVAKAVFDKRNIPTTELKVEVGEAIVFDETAEAARRSLVDTMTGPVAPALADYTNDLLFGDLWRRDDLSARDRSLVTIAALIAGGQAEQLPFHMNRGMDSGLTQTQLAEVMTHLAFYSGWPRAMSAIPVAKKVFEGRAAAVQDNAAPKQAAAIDILRLGAQPSSPGPADYFTGSVKVDSRFQREAPARIGGGIVTFEAGARTAWHTHPLGPTLFVTAGCGLVQREGGPIEEIRVGDIVWIPPGEKHWHGATVGSGMTHLAISEALDGKAVDWMEKVTDAQYGGKIQGAGAC